MYKEDEFFLGKLFDADVVIRLRRNRYNEVDFAIKDRIETWFRESTRGATYGD